jgi:hypothetical protein
VDFRLNRWRARRVDRRAASIPDAAEKLRFLRQALNPAQPRRTNSRRLAFLVIPASLAAVLAWGSRTIAENGPVGSPIVVPPAAADASATPKVWLVERKEGTDFYSNGLRVEGGWETSTRNRRYSARQRGGGGRISRTEPAGIVFHTTESQLAPFREDHNHALKANGEGLLAYVQQNALYHFVIDRFGRVIRIVSESDYANHSGHSIWADREYVYIDLNHPFFGVSFETQTGAVPTLSIEPQIAAARLLVEMLRAKYGIAGENCVTHAQVSVNPGNMQIGYHTDWATSFPFRELGLRSGYDSVSPAVALFGFSYGQDFVDVLGGKPWPGLVSAEQRLVSEAAAAGKTPGTYRRLLQQRYRTTAAAGNRAPAQ